VQARINVGSFWHPKLSLAVLASTPCFGEWIFEIFAQPNVSLVNVNATPLVEVREKCIKTTPNGESWNT
jgi:hypothetical protein